MEARLKTLEIAVDGDRLGATMLTPATRMPGLLFVHGWGGSQRQSMRRERKAVGLSCVCLTFDLRGHELHARMRETVTRAQNLTDVLAAYDLLAGLPEVDPDAIGVIGYSYGSYLSALLTAQRPVQWLALRSPAIYPDEPWDAPKIALNRDPRLPAYRNAALAPADNRALRAFAAFRGDALVVQAEHDAVVPPQTHRNYEAALAGAHSLTTQVLADADHALSTPSQQAAWSRVLMKWLGGLVRGERDMLAREAVKERRHAIPG
jgi:pimeloyl-ACP methyl ester carboxylesterase